MALDFEFSGYVEQDDAVVGLVCFLPARAKPFHELLAKITLMQLEFKPRLAPFQRHFFREWPILLKPLVQHLGIIGAEGELPHHAWHVNSL